MRVIMTYLYVHQIHPLAFTSLLKLQQTSENDELIKVYLLLC